MKVERIEIETPEEIEKFQEPVKSKVWLQNDHVWMYWPFQPVKRVVKGKTECGLYFVFRKNQVVECNIFMIPKTYEEYDAMPAWTYSTLDAMLAAGWRVD